MTGLHIADTWKTFGKVPVLRGVSLDAEQGSFVVIVGPSGCGKTTLLRALAGLEALDHGSIKLGLRDITNLQPAARNIAMVFQNYALYPTKTVQQNIAFGLRQRRMSSEEIERRVNRTCDTLEIRHLLERRPSQLSGGQRQRVAIGRAMVREPDLFLFDEPLSNLDAALRNDLRIEIKRIHRQMGTMSVFVTHDQLEAMSLADQLVVMRDGLIEQIGAPYEVFRNPVNRFVAGFIGSPAMQFIDAVTESGHAVMRDGSRIAIPALSVIENGIQIELGFRPDALSLVADGEGALPARIDVVQELGASRLIHLTTPSGCLSVLQSSDEPFPQDNVFVKLPNAALHVFEKISGKKLKIDGLDKD